MKIRNIQIALLSLVALLCLSACTLEGDGTEAGDLAGMWHCVYIEKGAQSAELRDKKVYWSFQGKLLLLEDKTGNHSRILYHFNKNGNTLELKEPYRYDRENGDELLTEPSLLAFYGIDDMAVTFTIQQSENTMALVSDKVTLHFKKF
ncbi:lipocalin-like domain-containing protein [Prevotella falsenii]|uniref:lipocalin-like domain-containing protein n=1 Tax=Prevotella falsenii TaxID=515414 RepID=UPI00046A990C|nr:lipocalin-like domain-containing protein [Prevotella falsenii]